MSDLSSMIADLVVRLAPDRHLDWAIALRRELDEIAPSQRLRWAFGGFVTLLWSNALRLGVAISRLGVATVTGLWAVANGAMAGYAAYIYWGGDQAPVWNLMPKTPSGEFVALVRRAQELAWLANTFTIAMSLFFIAAAWTLVTRRARGFGWCVAGLVAACVGWALFQRIDGARVFGSPQFAVFQMILVVLLTIVGAILLRLSPRRA